MSYDRRSNNQFFWRCESFKGFCYFAIHIINAEFIDQGLSGDCAHQNTQISVRPYCHDKVHVCITNLSKLYVVRIVSFTLCISPLIISIKYRFNPLNLVCKFRQ